MQKLARSGLFLFTIVLGLASLLATSPPPQPRFGLETLNDLRRVEGYHGGGRAFACEGEAAELYWDSYSEASWTLSTTSPESFSPALTRRRVGTSGTLELTVLGGADLTLAARGGGYEDGFLEVELLPDRFCTGFAFPLVGWYEASLRQSVPEPTTAEPLTRYLQLTYYQNRYSEDPAELRLVIAEDLASLYGYGNRLSACTLEGSSLRCNDEGFGGGTFTLEARVTETGLEGSYSGVRVDAGSSVSFEGTLSAVKQVGTPPAPAPEQP